MRWREGSSRWKKSFPRNRDTLSGLFQKYAHVRGNGFWAEARRERRAYPEVDLEGASNDASVQKTCRPEGCSEFGLWLRCSVGRVSLRIHSLPRASHLARWCAAKIGIYFCTDPKLDFIHFIERSTTSLRSGSSIVSGVFGSRIFFRTCKNSFSKDGLAHRPACRKS